MIVLPHRLLRYVSMCLICWFASIRQLILSFIWWEVKNFGEFGVKLICAKRACPIPAMVYKGTYIYTLNTEVPLISRNAEILRAILKNNNFPLKEPRAHLHSVRHWCLVLYWNVLQFLSPGGIRRSFLSTSENSMLLDVTFLSFANLFSKKYFANHFSKQNKLQHIMQWIMLDNKN